METKKIPIRCQCGVPDCERVLYVLGKHLPPHRKNTEGFRYISSECPLPANSVLSLEGDGYVGVKVYASETFQFLFSHAH